MSLQASSPTYWLAWSLSRSIVTGIYRGDIYGQANIPKTGPFILAGNHVSFFDPPAFGGCLPREIAYFARKSLFKPGWPSQLLKNLNSIPIDRDSDNDIAAFRQVFSTLKTGKGILLFPEGTRSLDGELQEAKKGVGLIACRAQVPIVPARIFGTFQAYSRQQKIPDVTPAINVAFGPALELSSFDPGKSHPQRYQKVADHIMEAIRALHIPDTIGAV